MKRFLFISLTIFMGLTAYMSSFHRVVNLTWHQKFERAMALTPMGEYHDDDYDYTIRYPAFFQRSDDTLMDKGTCRFSFWRDNIEVVQTAFVEHNPEMLTPQQAVKKYAQDLYADYQRVDEDSFTLSGLLHSDTGQITGRRFYAKFVQHRKFWFVQSLTYPEECEHALRRLLLEIDKWKVWKDNYTRRVGV